LRWAGPMLLAVALGWTEVWLQQNANGGSGRALREEQIEKYMSTWQ